MTAQRIISLQPEFLPKTGLDSSRLKLADCYACGGPPIFWRLPWLNPTLPLG